MKIPEKPPFGVQDFVEALTKGENRESERGRLLEQVITASSSPMYRGKYLHWDELRRRPITGPMTHKILWASLKLHRQGMMKMVPLEDKSGRRFQFSTPDPAQEILRLVDMEAGGSIRSDASAPSSYKQKRFVIKSLIEEAITSSQVEGASTTRRVAKEMIRSGRQPSDRSERMIMNNYLTMQYVRSLKSTQLSPDVIFDLHSRITEGTLKDSEIGRFRKDEEKIVVVEHNSGQTLHIPPPSEQLPRRLEDLCSFANGETPKYFLHPIVRSIILHFWLSHDHPFVDGNGRCARTLFYWSMLHHGYWLAEYISISRLIKKAQAQYSRAFLLTETDDNDLTYFLLYHLKLLKRSIADVHEYVARKTEETRGIETRLEGMRKLNYRQRALISHALKNEGFEYTVDSHSKRQQITAQTARSDLYDLVKRSLFEKNKIGRTYHFYAARDLESKLSKKSS